MYTSPLVFAGGSQRCQGLHIEAPGVILYDEATMAFAAGHEHHWGRGYFYEQDAFVGGFSLRRMSMIPVSSTRCFGG